MTEAVMKWNGWRIARWSAVAILLVLPLAMMQVVPDWNWGPGAFVLAGIVIGGPVLLYEVAAKRSTSNAYGLGAAVALATSFVTVWTTIVRDDGNGLGFFGAVFTAAACAFVAKCKAEGMARAMLATAGVQAMLAAMVATAPITEQPIKILMLSGVFCLLWLASAELFRRSARVDSGFAH